MNRLRHAGRTMVTCAWVCILVCALPPARAQNDVVGTNPAFYLDLDESTGAATPVTGLGLGQFSRVDGLAFDPNTNTLYGSDTFTDQLITIDPETGAGTAVGPLGFSSVRGLAFDPKTNTLYGSSVIPTGELITIDTATGAGTVVGAFGVSFVSGLAFDPNTNTLYGTSPDQLITIDTATGVGTPVGELGFSGVRGLAFDPNASTLYGTVDLSGLLITIDTGTGAGKAVGSLGFSNVWGLACDPNTKTLYATAAAAGQLITIDTGTGAGTPVGTLGFTNVLGLAFDPNTNTLYGTDGAADQLITIDTGTGTGTAVGAFGFLEVSDLAFDPNTNTLYGADTVSDQLITINTGTGAGKAVGALGFTSVRGLAFDPNTNTLYGTDTDSDQLITINTGTGAGKAVGALPIPGVLSLAFDPNTNTLYGSSRGTTAMLITIDTASAAATAVGVLGFGAVRGLAFDPNTNTLYGTDSNQLITINTGTGAGTTVGPLGFSAVWALAFDPNTNTLYGTDWVSDQLITIDTGTGEGMAVGALTFQLVYGLAFDPNTNTLYGIEGSGAVDLLITIDTETGAGKVVGAVGIGSVRGLTFDPYINTLYGTDESSGQLITIDTETGAGKAVGPTGHVGIRGLAVITVTLFVDADAAGANDGSSWIDAFNHLQDALSAATPGVEIWVAEGIYRPDEDTLKPSGTGDRAATFQLLSGVALFGGFAGGETQLDQRDVGANVTTLSGDLLGDDGPGPFENNDENSFHVVSGSGTDDTAVLDGFTITAGNATDPVPPNDRGAGVFNASGNPKLTNCTISGNKADLAGGMHNDNGSPTLIDCKFTGNVATVDGGGMWNNNSSAMLIHCTVSGNSALSGGGIYNLSGSSLTLTNCTFSGNSAVVGGAMVNNNSDPTLTNCTFSGNTATADGGGIRDFVSSPTLANSVLWSNSDSGGLDESAQIHNGKNSFPVVNFCDIQGLTGGLGGIGNIGADPLFIDADGPDDIPGTEDDNLRLSSGSPCIDAADNAAVLAGVTTDLDGNPRFVDDPASLDCPQAPGTCGTPPIVDMGAYEFFQDCNDNGIPDDCDVDCSALEGTCNLPGCGLSQDCDWSGGGGNGIPDECDIADCVGNVACEDCNLNGVPDLCDVPSSTGCPTGSCAENCSMDSDEDCVPDECSFWEPPKNPINDNWSESSNWFPVGVPDNIPEGQTFSVNVVGDDKNVILDIDVAINSLQLIDGPTLRITGGDLTIETEAGVVNDGLVLIDGDHSMSAGIGDFVTIGCSAGPLVGCFPPRGTSVANAGSMSASSILVLQGAFIHLADQAQIDATTSLNLVNGMYQADPDAGSPTSACTSAGSVLITNEPAGRGNMILQDTMSVFTSGDFALSPSLECQAGGFPPKECPPPRLEILDEAAISVGGDFIVEEGSEVVVSSSGGIASPCPGASGQGTASTVTVSGSFDNRGMDPSRFDWVNGSLALDGLDRTFEIAGTDLGVVEFGFVSNFAMGTLTVAGGANITFVDDFENSGSQSEALYVDTFVLGNGATAVFSAGAVYYLTFCDEGGSIIEDGGVFGEVCLCPTDLDVCTCDTCESGSCEHVPSAYGNASCDLAGVVDLDDILCVIAGFGEFLACPNGDVAPPCTGDGLIDLDDILGVIGAFGGADPCSCGG